jgi:exodeoxyribonuclease VII large subunit
MKLVKTASRPGGDDTVLSVSELTRKIKLLLERDIGQVTISGEISNFHRHSSGHLYFTLKDDQAQLSAVMFRGAALSTFFRPENGMEVVCRGTISVYEPRGQYQLIVSDMQPRGAGALQAAFERLRKRLHEEGLFDEDRKRPLPPYPRRIALVTSPTGAAIRDMISVIHRRNPSIEIVVVPVQVQGAGAAEQIARAIGDCNAFGDLDIILTGRGGGSIEDLWAFNEEVVARAIAASRIPVVSAVGHEVDVTIADYVADVRAATPSVAGEIVAPSLAELREMLLRIGDTLGKFVDFQFASSTDGLRQVAGHRAFSRPESVIRTLLQRLDDLYDRLERTAGFRVERISHRLELLKEVLRRHDPGLLLARGAAIATVGSTVISSVSQVREGDILHLAVRDGSIRTQVMEIVPDAEKTDNRPV